MRYLFKICLTCLILGQAAQTVQAQDAGLYKDIPDPNAAFIRIVASRVVTGQIQSQTLISQSNGISPYVQTEPGSTTLNLGGENIALQTLPGGFYSYVLALNGDGSLISDEIPSSPAQASLALYNLSDLPRVDLFVPQANVVALDDVRANQAAAVALKAPLTLDFEIQADGQTIAHLPQVLLTRRNGVTLLLTGAQGRYRAVAVSNTIAK